MGGAVAQLNSFSHTPSAVLCCSDVDECAVLNGGCEHYCTNLNGTHQCSCQEGYTLEGQPLRQCTRESDLLSSSVMQ